MLRLTRRTIAVLVVWLCILGARAAAADQIAACINPAGQMRLILSGESCRPQERLVVWNVQGPEGPQGPQGPQGAPGESSPGGIAPALVVDSADQVVGHIVSRTGEVLISAGSDRFFAGVNRAGFVNGGRFLYTLPGCAGTAYGNGVTPGALAHMALVSGTTAYVIDTSVPPVLLTPLPGMTLVLYTRLIDSTTGALGTCTQIFSGVPISLWSVKPVNLSTFVPPFRVQ